jgi:hypothetical protein
MDKRTRAKTVSGLTAVLMTVLTFSVLVADTPKPLPDPDGRPANMSKPVQVFILLGQSNMLGFGKIGAADKAGSLTHAVKEKGKYPYLVDDAGNWTVRKDVRNARVMGSGAGNMKSFNNEWMTITNSNIGPEIGIGHHVGQVTDAPVLILKSCIGNRSLGWDLLPPGSKQFEQDGMIYAGYKDSPDKWKKGETPKAIGWYAGVQYDGDIANAKRVLAELDRYYPGAKRYEIAGFFWWQGDKDRYNAVHASRYEQNLVQLIEQLRRDFGAPNAKFVCATLGQTGKGAGGAEGQILDAQLAVDGRTGKYRQFKGNVATVYSKPFCHGGASNSHYGGNAETYMDIGEAMGRAMAELLGTKSIGFKKLKPYLDDVTTPAYQALKKKDYVAAYRCLQQLEKQLAEDDATGVGSEIAENRALVFGVIDGELMGDLRPAVTDVTALKKVGDVYALSLIIPDLHKKYAGIDIYDSAAGDLSQQLKSSETRTDIAAGKKFYRYIENLMKFEAKSKQPRDARTVKSIQKSLARIADKYPDSIYGIAAAHAAEELGNSEKSVARPRDYVRSAAAQP